MRVETKTRPNDVTEPGCKGMNDEATKPQPAPFAERPFFPDLDVLATAVDAAKIGVWSWDIASNRITWSTNLEEHSRPVARQFRRHRFRSSRTTFILTIAPTCWRRSRNRCAPTNRTARSIVCLRKRDCEERWIEAAGTVVVEDGEPVRMVGTCRDVTERVTLHRELRNAGEPAGGGRTSRRTGAHRKRSAEILRRGGLDDREAARRGTGEDPRTRARRRRTSAAVGSRLAAGTRRHRLCLHRPQTRRPASRSPRAARSSSRISPPKHGFAGAPLLRSHDVVSGISMPDLGARWPRLWRARRHTRAATEIQRIRRVVPRRRRQRDRRSDRSACRPTAIRS